MLSSVDEPDTTIIADLEAGIGTLTRLPDESVDVVVVVVEPTPRSIDVARRAITVAAEKRQGRIVVVANKVLDDGDRQRVIAGLADFRDRYDHVVAIPQDDVVDRADREGVSPVDLDAAAPAVQAVDKLIAML